MAGEDDDNFEEAEEIINESDETVDDLVSDGDEELAADTEQYDEIDDDLGEEDFIDDDGDPEELNFEPDDDNFVEDAPESDDAA